MIRIIEGNIVDAQTDYIIHQVNCQGEMNTEKAIMWCLLKKCFKSKRSLEKVIYSMEDM